jgi:hypothetical protein
VLRIVVSRKVFEKNNLQDFNLNAPILHIFKNTIKLLFLISEKTLFSIQVDVLNTMVFSEFLYHVRFLNKTACKI